ncbi:MAG: hypothetical protein WC506_04365 [Candidatus Micrarchaeia archaeon]
MKKCIPCLAILLIFLGLIYGLASAYYSWNSDLVDAFAIYLGAIFAIVITLTEYLKKNRSTNKKKNYTIIAAIYLLISFASYAYLAFEKQYFALKAVMLFFAVIPVLLNVYKALEYLLQMKD